MSRKDLVGELKVSEKEGGKKHRFNGRASREMNEPTMSPRDSQALRKRGQGPGRPGAETDVYVDRVLRVVAEDAGHCLPPPYMGMSASFQLCSMTSGSWLRVPPERDTYPRRRRSCADPGAVLRGTVLLG